jgi:propanediol utilization protein
MGLLQPMLNSCARKSEARHVHGHRNVAVLAITYWTDRLSDKEAVQRPMVFDDDIVRQNVVFSSRLEIDRMDAGCDACHARHYCRQDTSLTKGQRTCAPEQLL